MTKDVLITIRGLQFAEEAGDEPVEMITSGQYYMKNNKHYLVYEEVVEGFQETGKSIIKIGKDYMELTKRGVTSVHMVFEKDKKNVTYYYTPYGSLLIGIDARKVEIEEKEGQIQVVVDYGLEVNYEHVADCHIDIVVDAKGNQNFRICRETENEEN